MTNFKNLSLEELEEKGISDLQVKLDPSRVKVKKGDSIIGSLPVSLKILLAFLTLLFLFGIANVPIYIWYFFYK